MIVKINKSKANGKIIAPPSKSYGHRLLISALLSNEKSIISNVDLSNDILATLSCLKALGKKIECVNEELKSYSIETIKSFEELDDVIEMNSNESGSTYRFMIPISLLTGKKIIMRGTKRLIERGIGEYERIFEKQNISYQSFEEHIELDGKLKPDTFEIKGNVSSQFITGLLFSLPLLEGDSKIVLTTPLESKNYVDITIDVLKKSNIVIEENEYGYYVKGNQKYSGLTLSVEGDHSNSAFLEAFNYIGGNVEVEGLNSNSFQGDKVFKEYFDKLSNGFPTLDISNCIDLGPILFCVAALNNGAHFIKTSRLKIKESNRIEAVKVELEKFGAHIVEGDDEVFVYKTELHEPTVELYGQNDHRVVMTLSVISSLYGGTITGAEAVKKSFPSFFNEIKKLGIEVVEIDK